MWRQLCLRGTGFPARELLALAAPHTSRLVDEALAEQPGGTLAPARRAVLQAAFDDDARRTSAHLRDLARAPRFREAVTWQNRGALHTGIDALLRRPPGATDARTRRYEQLVASYLQRYCAKNDTIGFFGPVGWARLDDEVATARVAPGRALLDRRTVYFEHWAIDAVATRLSEDRALRVDLPPRRMPTIRLDGTRLHYPIDRTTELPVAAARLLAACDGVRTARAIASALLADPALELASVDEVYDLLDELVDNRLAIWRIEIPTAGFEPERWLLAALARVPAGPAREAADVAVAQLEAARARVQLAAGDPAALDAALASLEETFVAITGHEATRGAGRVYVGRGIVFEDCRRDADVVLGRAFLDRIAAPLAMVQASARWFTHTVASRFRTVFAGVYDALVAELGTPDLDFIRFYGALRPHLSGQAGARSATTTAVRDELQRRWAEVLALPTDGTRRVELRAAELAPRIAAAFAAPGPGWPSARHNSPDVLIAAAGPEALARGELVVVLGEVHAGVNAVTVPALAKEHVDPAGLHDARQADVGPTIAYVEPRASGHRARTYSLSTTELDVELGDARSHRPRQQVFDVAGFVVARRGDQLVARRRDGSFEVDLVAFLEGELNGESYIFDMFGPGEHRPRVTVDGFVLARERWRFDTAALAFAGLPTPLDRFVGARRWAAAHGLPRFVFVKAAAEPKPVYVDFEAPIFVDMLCKLVRADASVTVSEMLPTFEQLWLTDAEGAAYCSELRMSLVDDVAFSPPA